MRWTCAWCTGTCGPGPCFFFFGGGGGWVAPTKQAVCEGRRVTPPGCAAGVAALRPSTSLLCSGVGPISLSDIQLATPLGAKVRGGGGSGSGGGPPLPRAAPGASCRAVPPPPAPHLHTSRPPPPPRSWASTCALLALTWRRRPSSWGWRYGGWGFLLLVVVCVRGWEGGLVGAVGAHRFFLGGGRRGQAACTWRQAPCPGPAPPATPPPTRGRSCQRVIYHLLEDVAELVGGAAPRVEHQARSGGGGGGRCDAWGRRSCCRRLLPLWPPPNPPPSPPPPRWWLAPPRCCSCLGSRAGAGVRAPLWPAAASPTAPSGPAAPRTGVC